MSLKEKFVLPVIILSAAVFLAGCGQKNDAAKQTAPVSNSAAFQDKLPKPTGETEDIVNATLEDISAEEIEISAEENEAQKYLEDNQETDDFGQAYDENEF